MNSISVRVSALFWTKSLLLASTILLSNSLLAAGEMPPPPSVDVITVKPEKIRVWKEFSGRLAAVNAAEIKPQVSGEITQVLFKDGQVVKKGQRLFVIDPRPYEAELNRKKAQVASAKSRAKLAKEELERARKLVKNKLVSDSVYDTALNEYEMASMATHEAESAIVETQINLDYSYITAPFDGRISRAELTVGNVVESTMNAPVLAKLVSNNTLYAEFDVDEMTYIQARRKQMDPQTMPVELKLAGDETYTYKGKLYSFDNELDVASGTIRARAIFDNTDGVLTPGMFANVRLGSTDKKEVLLVPQKAVGTNQNKKFVFVVDDKNIANYRPVVLGEYYQDSRVVISGLKVGDRVITNGLSHIRPNSPVTPKDGSATKTPSVAQ